ncbi:MULTISPECIES: class I SAM-dependent methyltransferase [Hyphomonas]|uniref:class I SAM-dependent methyltransferase n=1 Tax=Hyphomonas TaxID=85 RepID=UPI0035112F85
MKERASTAGYAEEAPDLFVRYEARDAAAVHAPWAEFLPKPPARVLDIGAGTGRDAAWFARTGHFVLAVEPVDALRTGAAELHPEPSIIWLDDALPDLTATRARGESFDMILMHAVWMHLTEEERVTGMANVASLLKPGGHLFLSQRHGPIPEGRRMFDISGDETIALAAPHGLTNLYCNRAGSIQAENMALGIEWTKLVFEKSS